MIKKNKTKEEIRRNYKFKTEGGERSMARETNATKVLNSIEVRKKTDTDVRSRLIENIRTG